MIAFQIRNKTLALTRKAIPTLRPEWALIRVRLAGICNTDVEILGGYHNFHGTPGHEFVGEVQEMAGTSRSAKGQWIGKRVAGEINIACHALGFRPVCRFCKRGLTRHCERRKVLGIVAHDGAFAEYLTLPVENLHSIPDSVSDEAAVFVEPLAAACEILDQCNVKHFHEAAVLGDGKLAQLIGRVLRSVLPRVVLYGKHEAKLGLARTAKIETKHVRGDAGDLKRVTEKFGLVVEATGSPSGLVLAQEMTEPRGTLVLKSTFHGATPVETWPIVVKELNLIGSRCGPFDKAIALLRSGKVDPRPLITRTFAMREAADAMAFAQKPGVMKVLLKNG
jgi:threonine dehydrogenase-like Zn-dependent dehydrogenase